ncbi:hypothetical protein [Methylobacterium radiotolerans]|uniref:hypothetical protein n=1 Tax=Methylobacterium radiotolerans TaxID=31998 RepID=UPI00097651A8|nr:hypothetical protein [Methylobacterium radiotolerans]
MRLYSRLLKTEQNDDGTLTVEGIASTEAVDATGETILASAIKAALPDYLRLGTGALREMHGLSAAGTVDVVEVNDDGLTRISATVVDPVAVTKIKAGVYKGLSVGGKYIARDPKNKKIVTKIKLTEISLVDSPCNPEAVLTMWKADAVQTGDAGPDLTAAEVRDALQALPDAERAMVLVKAALALPRGVDALGRRRVACR